MPNHGQPERRRLDIRKYANRRFYDATRSKHVTQEEIHQFIRNGHEVRVTDAKTGEDITVRVLAQIMLDMDEPKLAVFPVELLHRLIQSNETLMRDFVEKYFNQALMLFLESRKKFEEQLRTATGLGIVPPQAMDWVRMMGTPFLSPLATNVAHPPTASAETEPRTDERTQELERAVRELQEQVQLLQGKQRRGNGLSRKKTARRPAQRS
jgi:polyhydroxyalkanoate synthesis repressor PhaR